jgi:hypothetical protein
MDDDRSPRRAVTVIPNGVDVDQFHPDAVPRRALPARYAVFVGELTPWQGLATVLAAAQSPSWPQEVSLMIAGDSQLRFAVEGASRDHPERVVYVGPVAHDEVPGLLAASLCAIVSSRDREGLRVAPLKLFGAMAAGVPVVGTDVRDVAQVVEEAGCGFVVPTGDAQRLATAVAQVAMDPQGAAVIGRRWRTAVVSTHSWDERAGRTAVALETGPSSVGRSVTGRGPSCSPCRALSRIDGRALNHGRRSEAPQLWAAAVSGGHCTGAGHHLELSSRIVLHYRQTLDAEPAQRGCRRLRNTRNTGPVFAKPSLTDGMWLAAQRGCGGGDIELARDNE